MSDTQQLLPTRAAFAAVLNSGFVAQFGNGPAHSLKLTSVDELVSNELQEAFSLKFLASPDAPRAQGTVHLKHDELGTMDLFIVPIGLDESGLHFEAIFNHFHDVRST